MNADHRLEREVADVYQATAPSQEPPDLLDHVLLTTSRTRQRPSWLALTKEPPMRISSHVAVGSPMARVAALAAATILLVVLMTGAVVAGAAYLAGPATIVVAQDGSGDFETITDALAAAEDGDTVLVKPGTYEESVLIDKDITLKGDGAEGEVVLQFDVTAPDVPSFMTYGPVPYGILLEDSSATVSDLTILGPVVGMGIAAVAGAPTIERVVVELEAQYVGSPHTFIGLANQSGATIRDSRGDGPIWGLDNLAAYGDLRGTGKVTIVGNQNQDFISFVAMDGSVVTGNTLAPTGGIEVMAGDGGNVEIAGNDVSWVALSGGDGSGLVVRDNTIAGGLVDNGAAITLGDGSPTIEANRIRDTRIGVLIQPGGAPTIRSNTIEGNEIGINVRGEAAPVIEGNRFCGNEQDLVVPDASELTLDASNEVCPRS